MNDCLSNGSVLLGTFFGIDRHRIHGDGEGVTTLVAFMGCPLHCRYCINQRCHDNPYGNDGKLLKRGYVQLTSEELYDRIKIDDIYFQATGGGICFGGGEPMQHSKYIREFKKLCPGNWRITVETALACSLNDIEILSPIVDEWIIDIKDMNPEIYEKYTGSELDIYKSLAFLKKTEPKGKVIIKVPHIPNYNSSDDVKRSKAIVQEIGFENIVEFQYVKLKNNEI